ncbi:MAG TPA: hypothetical protein VK140_02280 [Ktedonobacteraceae bacterium]|nr:hypothetical protein [Ktedonobacteraceae bacterium]
MKQSSSTSSTSTQPLQALRERIEREAPWLHIIRCVPYPHPFIEVKDTSNLNIHVTFSTEVELATYVHIVGRGGTST